MKELDIIGTIPLSRDVLVKANIGLWAFELDEGSAPKMFVDDTMLGLIGLDHQVSPEETYHAWYDNIDESSYDLVNEAVGKMMAGEHAEVQYPWHNPDGRTLIVRCGGVRNPLYKRGIRIEGTHQNVTEVLHFDEETIERLKNAKIKLEHEHLRSEVLNYMIDHDDDPIELLKNFAEQIRVLIGCDQVIYRDLEETRIMVNSPAIEDTWSVPFEYCKQCQHLDPHHPMYAGGYTEMDNCQEGWQGIPVYHKCPIKSSLTRLVYCDGEVAGYLAIHYVVNYHHFTDEERSTLEEFTRILSISLSRYASKQRSSELEGMKRMMNMIFSLSDEFDPIMVLNAETGEYDWYMGMTDDVVSNTSMNSHGDNFYKDIGIDGASIVHEEDRAKFHAFYTKENMMKIIETGETQEIENRWFVQTEGMYKWKYNKAVRMVDTTGKAYVVLGVIDKTEAKAKEQEHEAQKAQLKEDTEMISSLASEYLSLYYINLNEHIFKVYSIDGNRLADTKELLKHHTDAFELIHMFAKASVHPDDQNMFLEFTPESVRERLSNSKKFTLRFRRDYGKGYQWSEMDVVKSEEKNEAANSVIIGFAERDKEIRKEIEQQARLKEALLSAQSANRAKTTFLNNMSHDIRTPMNAIIGYTGLAASHIENKEQVQDYLSKISQSSDHLLSLINDVLDMSRIESGKMNIEEKEENLSDIIHTLRDIVQADVHSKQLDFFVDAVDVNNEDVICDKLRLNQVLLNVLSNAIKYTQSGGTITMRVRERTVKESGYGKYEFCIKDNGMGMEKAFLSTIFDPFTRVKSTTVSGIQGTGLGMAITKNIIDMMGGTIDIQSEPGKGTEVTIVFDFKLVGTPKAPVQIPELNAVRGLVVDDDSNTCMSIANMLRDIGMRAEWCTSGKEAVLRAGEGYRIGDSFKVLIIDWLMPDMNGIETTRRIRKVIGDDVPIIILTAYDWADIEDEAKEAGVTAFVSKPMFPSDLHRVLCKCLGKEDEIPVSDTEQIDLTGKKILLVEDNELNREIATAILEEYGCAVTPAEDGDVAVEMIGGASKGEYDLVLMDVQMPRMNGYEATRKIRALGTEISKIPIIAMTANAFEEDRKMALEAGMNEHIAKPIDINKLKATLGKYL